MFQNVPVNIFTTSAVILLLLAGVSSAEEHITIGSFNIEWFGHANKPRTEQNIIALAGYILSLNCDVLCCQEINPFGDQSGNGVPDWSDLLNALGTSYKGTTPVAATISAWHLYGTQNV